VKNGAELLDRLIKDIVAESAASYVSVLQQPYETGKAEGAGEHDHHAEHLHTAFSLERFLPLLEERINVINPFARVFLVAWITLLDSIPDLELVTHLPRFLGGLFKFVSDSNEDVRTATQHVLDKFLNEIKKIARIKRGVTESRKSQEDGQKQSNPSSRSGEDEEGELDSIALESSALAEEKGSGSEVTVSTVTDEEKSMNAEDDWIPGQDVQVDHPKILNILVSFLGDANGASYGSLSKTVANTEQKTCKSNSQR
jgi:vacuole morphology and inheritance protein 14